MNHRFRPTPLPQEARMLERARELPNARTGMDVETLRRAFADHLQYSQGKDEHTANALDRYLAVAHVVRDRLMHRWIRTRQANHRADPKRVYYLSLEFLMGRALGNNLINLGLYEPMKHALADVGCDLDSLLEEEIDAGLGNGGLGRLAACFLDSMATLGLPAHGYGIRYEFGIFDQEIHDGWQVERPEEWLRFGNPWEVARPEYLVHVNFYGRTDHALGPDGRLHVRWVDTRKVLGVPYDTPIAGFRNDVVNTLRLWQARASEEFDLSDFNAGDYLAAVEEKNLSENISKVLYPNDLTVLGKELRLQQQYFFVACSIADIVRRHQARNETFDGFADRVAIQLNDTHPAIAIAELMRVLVDDHGVAWDRAWETTRATFGYTNHTLLPESLERWPVEMIGRMLPRHLEIVYEINARFLDGVRRRFPDDAERVRRMSVIEEGPVRSVRMAHLAVVGSHSVNGVAALHSELLRTELLRDFSELWPERFNNKTNGITPRRWLLWANPALAATITECIDPGWTRDLDDLRRLEPLAEDAGFRRRVRDVKRQNKQRLAAVIERECGVRADPDSLFDVQVKRIHEYKRQLLNVMHVIALWQRIKSDPRAEIVPRTVMFGGKAAPGYAMAKLIIRLIHGVADVVNHDPDVRGRLCVAFLKNYRVSLAERIVPAADLSEQISTAGKEASGTGNMKFALNGALTIGTLDGANVEIREAVGAENFFLFGLTVGEVREFKRAGWDPRAAYRADATLRAVVDAIGSGVFADGDASLYRPIVHGLLDGGDPYLHLADFADYLRAQADVERAWLDPERWTRMAILNIARMGPFSSDRTIRQYAEEIWRVKAG